MDLLKERQRNHLFSQAIQSWTNDPDLLASKVGMTLDPWQRLVLTSPSLLILLCCGRQVGKSSVTALLVVRELLKPNAMVVLCSNSERQAKELMRTVIKFFRLLGKPVQHLSVTKTSLELANGARLEAFPASAETVRGLAAVTLLVIDEAAVVSDELYAAVSPMLSVSNGRLVALSTPAGKRGWFWQLWSEDQDSEKVIVTSEECPRISKEYLRKERGRIGDYFYFQEFLAQWHDPITSAFRTEDIIGALDSDVSYDYELSSLLAG